MIIDISHSGSAGTSVNTQIISGAVGVITVPASFNYVLVDTSGGPCSFSFPVASQAGRNVTLVDYKGTTDVNPVTATIDNGGLFNGAVSSLVMNSKNSVINFTDNGNLWNTANPVSLSQGGTASSGGYGALTINGLGDSITARDSIYTPLLGASGAPAWARNTAYSLRNNVRANGNFYYCSTAGTSSAGGTGPAITNNQNPITDGTAAWTYIQPQSIRTLKTFLHWVEIFSNGRVRLDQSVVPSSPRNDGLAQINVVNGGGNYTAPTVTLQNGATATLQARNGVITGATVTNPGAAVTLSYTVNDATGSGGILSLVNNSSGTFGLPSQETKDCLAFVPTIIASPIDVIVVLTGTNDILNGVAYATIIANLKLIYERLMNGGKKVVAVTIIPRNPFSSAQQIVMQRVNRWIRAYCSKEAWANPVGYTNICLADPAGYLTNGASMVGAPIGGAGGTAGAVTDDGTHPSQLGAFYMGAVIWDALKKFFSPAPDYVSRAYSAVDGYDFVNNPGGNMLEAPPWAASTAYLLGQMVSNSSKIYACITAGTTASSGGPTTTSGNITDGTAHWQYIRVQGISVLASGTSGTFNAAAGIVYSGNLATGLAMFRNGGSASGTIAGTIENPWSNGQVGQRQKLVFSLGSGTDDEEWGITVFNDTFANVGFRAADAGVLPVYVEWELELSGVANLTALYAEMVDPFTSFKIQAGGQIIGSGVGQHFPPSTGAPIAYPNNGKILLRSQPMILPSLLTNLQFILYVYFDASGAADSATATIKTNYIGFRAALQA